MQTRRIRELRKQIAFLQAQLEEPQQTVEALRSGQVDAVVVSDQRSGPDVYTINRCTRVSELEDIARAIREGAVDALVMGGENEQAVFTLHTVQEALRQSEERLRVAVKNSRIVVYTTDCDLRYTWIENPHPAFKSEDVIGKRDDELLPPDFAAPLMRLKQDALDSGDGRRGEVDVVFSGQRFVYDVTVEPVRDVDGHVTGLTCAAMEITERKMLEEDRARHAKQLAKALEQRTAELTEAHEANRRTETMAVLGTLSAGIAHDLGNLLLPLRARLAALNSHDVSAELAEHIEGITRNVEYIADLATRLRQSMSNSNAGHSTLEPLSLSRWGRESEQFFRTVIPPSVKFECQVPPELPPVTVDKIGLTQAVYNLVQNSVKAVRKSGMGQRITVRAFSDKAHQVVVCVEDDGSGMSRDVLERCMEPRFTTDAETGGTGLGLPLVRTFVESAGGTLEIVSPPPGKARGTSVLMRLPAHRHGATTISTQTRHTGQIAANMC